ncbi:glycosyltransferase family protein [Thiomicrorhabdus arctica]|uniref:hypothetical protein n=1 Tax=Thiomicrorhabdus arctica TaxID=131540 RepID=UPI0003823485|nr:hypothetical protein [Thiomicrorhabdus arctica]
MIHVICLKWGDKYGPEYVNRLFKMVTKHLSKPFEFHCLTENSDGIEPRVVIESIPDYDLQGWWYKLVIFEEGFLGIPKEDKILFLDLDIVILNALDSLVTYSDKFCISADINEQSYNSSVMCFHPGQYRFIWESFNSQKETIVADLHGDQDWIEHVYKDAVIFPKSIVKSFKIDLNSKTKFSFGSPGRYIRKKFPILLPTGRVEMPKDAAIVLFHGKPDPIDVMDGPYDKYKYAPWIKDTWL